MSNTNLITNNFKYQRVTRLVDDVANSNYYFFVGDHLPHENVTLQAISDNVNNVLIDAYDKMVMGKKVSILDVRPVIANIPWSTQPFTMYNDQRDLLGTAFYCIVDEGSFFHVWKCLDNNNGANSTVQPSFAEGAISTLYQTSDGYRWKYITSIGSATALKFSTVDYFPLVSNTAVAANNVDGRIDVIKISDNEQGTTAFSTNGYFTGRFYNNYIDGTFTLNDIHINSDSTLFNIANNVVKTTNGYYTGCILYITGGTGQGQYQTIVDYVSNTTGNILKTAQQFLVVPQNGSTFEIRPEVIVTGDGNQTINCVARALVNAYNSNAIFRIEVLATGAGYHSATAQVVANAVVGVTGDYVALLQPIMSPPGGHGLDCYNELFCRDVEFSVTLANTENNTLPVVNQYQQIGLLKNPLFQDVTLTLLNTTGNFTSGEQIFVTSPKQFNTNCTVNTSSHVITCNTASFQNQVAPGDFILVGNPEGTVYRKAQINTVTSATSVNVTANLNFSCTEALMFHANITSNCYCSNIIDGVTIQVTNCAPVLHTLSMIIGAQTGSLAVVNTIERNDVVKQFDTFIELYKYNATLTSGTFTINEKVFQGNNYGYIHHTEGSPPNISAFISGMNELFVANSTVIVGETSGAIASLSSRYNTEIVFGSGQVQYLENIDAVTRQATQSENFQIIINF